MEDLNKFRRQAQQEAQKSRPQDTPEELERKAQEVEARQQTFAALNEAEKMTQAKAAGFDSIEEYLKETDLDPRQPNLHRVRLAALKARQE